jgi:hypothetical protein
MRKKAEKVLSFRDWLIADYDEEEIERHLVERLKGYVEADIGVPQEVLALRRIDELQLNGTYEAERKRLKDAVAVERAACALPPEFVSLAAKLKQMPDFDERVGNLLRGLKSPDKAQRARFQMLVEKERLNDRPLLDYWHILSVLEEAKKASGRPAKGISKNDAALLRIMKCKCCCEGVSIPKAAKQVAPSVKDHGVESVAKRLEIAYRKKMALRDWPPARPGKIIIG